MNKALFIILLLIIPPNVDSNNISFTITSEGNPIGGGQFLYSLNTNDSYLSNNVYMSINYYSGDYIDVPGNLQYNIINILSDIHTFNIPSNFSGEIFFRFKLFVFNSGFEPNNASAIQIDFNLLQSGSVVTYYTISPKLINSVGYGPHEILWDGAKLPVLQAFSRINYSYVFYYGAELEFYSNYSGLGPLRFIEYNKSYTYYQTFE